MARTISIARDVAKCHGESHQCEYICDGRDYCLRYVAPANPYQVFADFWKSGVDCPHGLPFL